MFQKIVWIGLISLFVLLLAATPASAHNAALLMGDNLSDAMAADYNDYIFQPGTTKSVLVIQGHGFEYDFGNLTTPVNITIVAPDGTTSVVVSEPFSEDVEKILSGETDRLTYQKINYNFTQSGTYYLYTSFEEEGVIEVPKLAVFVGDGTWDDWNKNLGLPLEFTTFTRMAGFAEGETVFGKLIYQNGTGAANVKYYAEPVKTASEAKALYDMLVSDYATGESIYLIYSKRAMTDESGNFVSAIPEKGVWSFVGSADINGTTYKAVYVFPVLPQFYGTPDAPAPAPVNETPGFGAVFAVLAIVGMSAVLFMRRK